MRKPLGAERVDLTDSVRKSVAEVVELTWGIGPDLAFEATELFLAAMDEAELVVMPAEPSSMLIETSMDALAHIGPLGGSNKDAEKTRHSIRYEAMVRRQRAMDGLSPPSAMLSAEVV